MTPKFLCLVATSLVCSSLALAQSCGEWLPGAPAAGPLGPVRSLCSLPGGGFLAAGEFAWAGDRAFPKIAAYNVVTQRWEEPSRGRPPGFIEATRSAAILPSGAFVIAGRFQGQTFSERRLVRQSAEGMAWETLGTLSSVATVDDIIELPDGSVAIAGTFSSVAGQPARNIALFRSSTGTWDTLGGGTTGEIRDICALPDGDIVACGSFVSIGGVTAIGVARWDSATGTWSAMGLGLLFGSGFSLALMGEDNLYVGGDMTNVDGRPSSGVALYHLSNGTWELDPDGPVRFGDAMTVDHDGNLVVMGRILFPGDLQFGARFTPSTGLWTPLGYLPLSSVPGGVVSSAGDYSDVEVLQDGTVVASRVGSAWTVGGRSNLDVFVPSLGQWGSFPLGTDGPVTALTVLSNGDVLCGGDFTQIAGVRALHMARYRLSTRTVEPLGAGTLGDVNAFLELPDGSFLVVGEGIVQSGDPYFPEPIARFDPVSGTLMRVAQGVVGDIRAITLDANGDIVVGGDFDLTDANNVPTQNLARIESSTGRWLSMGFSSNQPVEQLALLPNGEIAFAATFEFVYDGNRVGYDLARLTAQGELRPLGALGPDATNRRSIINCLRVMPDGRLLVGGRLLGSAAISGLGDLAILDPLTNQWVSRGLTDNPASSPPTIGDAVVLADGDIIAIGDFRSSLSGVPLFNIARYSTQTSTWYPLASNLSPTSTSRSVLAALPDGSFLMGGPFAQQDNNLSAGLAQWRKPCPGDFTCDRAVDSDDIIAFFAAWNVSDLSADIDRSGSTDGDDVVAFFGFWDTGC